MPAAAAAVGVSAREVRYFAGPSSGQFPKYSGIDPKKALVFCCFFCCSCGLLSSQAQNTKPGCCILAHSMQRVASGNALVDGDQLARLAHRGVGGSRRVMVQHARVVVGSCYQLLVQYYHGTIHIWFYWCCPACCAVWGVTS